MSGLWIVLGIVFVLGFTLGTGFGRWLAELGRAQHDARKAYRTRGDYRDRP